MKEPGSRLFLISFFVYLITNLAFSYLWGGQKIGFKTAGNDAISAAVFSGITWFFAYRRYAKAEGF